MYLVGILLFLFFCVVVVVFSGGANLMSFLFFLDLPSFFLVILLAWPIILACGLGKSLCKAFPYVFNRKKEGDTEEICRSLLAVKAAGLSVLCSGVIVTTSGLILMMHRLDDPAQIGPNLTVCIISLLYAILIDLLLLPVYYRLKLLLLKDENRNNRK